nr:murein biosynthesis integral membrane protein MurJ [Nocardia terpenica]
MPPNAPRDQYPSPPPDDQRPPSVPRIQYPPGGPARRMPPTPPRDQHPLSEFHDQYPSDPRAASGPRDQYPSGPDGNHPYPNRLDGRYQSPDPDDRYTEPMGHNRFPGAPEGRHASHESPGAHDRYANPPGGEYAPGMRDPHPSGPVDRYAPGARDRYANPRDQYPLSEPRDQYPPSGPMRAVPPPGQRPPRHGQPGERGPVPAQSYSPERRAQSEPRPLPRRLPSERAERSGPPRTAQQVAVRPEAGNQSSTASLVRDSGSIAVATLISRITGFVKQLLLVTVLGAAINSSFTVASQIPTMVEQLVLGAVLTAFVVPTLVRAEKEDADGGAAFVRRLITMAFVILVTAAVLCTASAPVLIKHFFLPEDGKVDTHLTTALAFMLLPAILFYGMSSLLMAVLNTHQIFKPGAWAPVLNNLVVIAVLGIYSLTPGRISLHPVQISDPKLLTLGLGVTFGVFVQVASLLPAIRRAGIDLRPLWGFDTRLREFGGMATAVILYVMVSQVGFVIATRISSHADAAGPTIYNQAWLLLQLPYGVLGVTVLTAIMPRLSRNAAADDTPAVVDDLSVATRLTMITLVPVVTFLTVAGHQVGEALYGYGNFGTGDAGRLGEALSWSAFTLIPYALVLIHLRVFYAREQAWTPTWIILGITVVRVVLSIAAPMVFRDDQVVIALGVATGLGYAAGAVIGGWLLHRSLGDLRMTNVGRTIVRVVLSSVAGGAVLLIADQVIGLNRLSESFGGLGSLVRVGIDAVVMFGVAFALMRLAGVPEIVALTVAVSRRLGLTPPAPDLGLAEAAADLHDTTVLPRPELDTPYYYRYDPYMDAQTMVLPVIRPNAVERTGPTEFPYPVRQRNANAGSGTRAEAEAGNRAEPGYGPTGDGPGDHRSSTHQGEGGTRVSDDAAGGVPAADAAAGTAGAVRTDNVPPAQVPPAEADDAEPGETEQYAEAAQHPAETAPPTGEEQAVQAHDQTYDTGMLPVGSPEMPPMRVESANRRVQRGPKLIAGASVAGGRYRLLAGHGGARGLRFWQALDVKLDREVALTFVDADQKANDNAGHDGPQAILSRTLRLGRINSPGLARVLDVVRGSSGGIVVAEWTPGRSLREMAETSPSPIGAARAIRALAAAAELAHRGGGSLSIDHPDRIRISASGDAVLAFPGTLADSDAQSDVRGLGAMLYALITARWPIRSGGVSGTAATVGGLRLADLGPDGTPVEPRQIRPEVPFEISAVAVRSLESNKGVRTAATVQHVLEQASVVDQKTDFIPVLRLGQRSPSAPDESLADPELLAAEKERSQRMMWILVGLGVLAALVVGVIIWWLLSIFAPGSSNAPLDEQRKLGLTTAAVAPPAPSAASSSAGTPTTGGGIPVPATSATVFSPEGTPDNPGGAAAVLDGNPATTWRTDQYFQQFPALKKGVGILATLGSPSKLTKVGIDSPSPGTVVEIRTSPTANPTLDQTQLIGQATLGEGSTDIAVRADQPARYVLVWITALANSGGQFQSSIGDIHFEAAP